MASVATIVVAAEAATEPAFNFLMLPLELRNLVYIELLVSPLNPHDRPLARKALAEAFARTHAPYNPSRPATTPTTTSKPVAVPYIYPAILSTCRRIHQEATPILYTANTFTAHASLLTALPCFLDESRKLLAPAIVARRHICRWHVSVRLDCDPRFGPQKLKEAFDGSEELTVAVSEAMYRSSGLHNILMFAGVRGVKRAAVAGSIDRPVAEWLERVMCCAEGAEVPALEEWMSTESTMYGGVLDDRSSGADVASNSYDAWVHGHR